MTLYLIAIGGTGAKCAEAVVHLAAIGLLGTEPIRILFVDPDEANGNLERARKTISIYQNCHRVITASGPEEQPQNPNARAAKSCSWMQTPIELYQPDVWSPLSQSDNRTLEALFHYYDYQSGDDLRNLFDVLYTPEERELQLNEGFRGRPAIGAAVMSQLDLAAVDLSKFQPWANLFKGLQLDGSKARIVLLGSAFGGTGAAGFPTLGRILSNQLNKDGYEKVKIGGALVLPYFEFSIPPQYAASTEIYARPEQFLLNTEAALRYYRIQAQNSFDTIYLLGSQNLAHVNNFSLGRGSQRNAPHFIELYAALAAHHFQTHQPKQKGEAGVMSHSSLGVISWRDLPGNEVKQKLVNATRFAFAWLSDIQQTLEDARTMNFEAFPKLAPWSVEYFAHRIGRKDLPDFNQQLSLVPAITEWCESYLRWLGHIHTSSQSPQVQLFEDAHFFSTSGSQADENNSTDSEGTLLKDSRNFFKLVVGSVHNEKDTIERLKNQLRPNVVLNPNRGVVGLARSLYTLCEQ